MQGEKVEMKNFQPLQFYTEIEITLWILVCKVLVPGQSRLKQDYKIAAVILVHIPSPIVFPRAWTWMCFAGIATDPMDN